MKISSSHNDRVKFVKRLQRRRFRDRHRLFIAEGLRLVEDLLRTDKVRDVYYSEQLLTSKRGRDLLTQVGDLGINVFACDKHVFSNISTTENEQGVLAVVNQTQPVADWDRQLNNDIILIIDRIQDPGNLGTIMRTALATGISGIWLVRGTVDLFNPKVVRASMGAILNIPFAVYSQEQCMKYCDACGLKLIVTDIDNSNSIRYYDYNFKMPLAVVIGNEAHGVGEYFKFRAQARVSIPVKNLVESLNAAVASSVILYEIVRQRESKQL